MAGPVSKMDDNTRGLSETRREAALDLARYAQVSGSNPL
jgi:hypothetical protein